MEVLLEVMSPLVEMILVLVPTSMNMMDLESLIRFLIPSPLMLESKWIMTAKVS